VKRPFPQIIEPMMASLIKDPFDSPDWIFEIKMDGYRAIAVIDSAGKARIWSRNRLPLEPKFPTVRDAVEELNLRSTILDGEIVALDEKGIPRFQLLQKWQKRPTAPVAYVLFDLLWDNGRDLTGKSVIQRRERLQEIITPVAGIQVGGYLEKRGGELFQLAKAGSGMTWALHFDNALSPSVFLLLPIFSLKSKIFSSLIALGRAEPRPSMPLSLHIAQGNARRVAGRNRPAKLPARISVLRPHFGLGLLPEHGARVTNI
jgi:hypothetical protein